MPFKRNRSSTPKLLDESFPIFKIRLCRTPDTIAKGIMTFPVLLASAHAPRRAVPQCCLATKRKPSREPSTPVLESKSASWSALLEHERISTMPAEGVSSLLTLVRIRVVTSVEPCP